MVSRALLELGLPMGNSLSAMSLEDEEFREIAKRRDWASFQRLCAVRNSTHPKWGLKLPQLRSRLPKIERWMRNPRFIVTFRDLLAIASRRQAGDHVFQDLQHCAAEYSKLAEMISLSKSPILLVSYEKALLNPGRFVSALQEFCGLSGSADRAVASISPDNLAYRIIPEAYRTIPEPVSGCRIS
jgi:hypothetical protein